MLINKNNSLLMIIDIQEKLIPAMSESDSVIKNSVKLSEVAQILNVPYLITEQYPKGLGGSIFQIKEKSLDESRYFAKLKFSCAQDDSIKHAIENSGKRQILICGIETHICVAQTAIDLKNMGYEVFIIADACSSRVKKQKKAALKRLAANGIEIVTTEMVLFEWLEEAGSEIFKTVSKKYIV